MSDEDIAERFGISRQQAVRHIARFGLDRQELDALLASSSRIQSHRQDEIDLPPKYRLAYERGQERAGSRSSNGACG